MTIGKEISYRPDIDGLRAIAVLSVVLFHAGLLPGGYLGVDVFFVISGYLIAGIILRDVKEGKFSFRKFYEGRVRRICPALLTVILASFLAGFFLLPPSSFERFSYSAIASMLSVSNILFWQEADYFDDSGPLKPLLHTWSLGIEGQFYLLFPLIFILSLKYARAYALYILVAGFLVSLLLAEWMISRGHLTGNFYLLPFRGWELLAGAIAAYIQSERKLDTDYLRSSLAVGAGLLLIGLPVLWFDAATPHPGLPTLAPVLGAFLLVLYGKTRNSIQRALSAPILVSIGLMSYSLYLWHQPVFAYFRLYSYQPPELLEYSGLVLLSFVLAYLSFRYVELPFRNRKKISWKKVSAFGTASAAICGLCSLLVIAWHGMPERFDEIYKPVFAALERKSPKTSQFCNNLDMDKPCLVGDKEASPRWALVGDSHAGTLEESLSKALQSRGESAVFLAAHGCAYLKWARDIRNCRAISEFVHMRLQQPDITRVIIMNRVAALYHRTPFNNGEGGVEQKDFMRLVSYTDDVSDTEWQAEILNGSLTSIRELLKSGKRVYLVYPVLETGWNIPRRMFQHLMRGDRSQITIDADRVEERSAPLVRAYDSLGEHKNLVRIYPEEILCDTAIPGRCITRMGSRVLYSDDDHLSSEGASLIVREMFRPAK